MHRLRSLLLRGQAESDLDAELRDHLDRAVASNVAAGMSEEEARRRANAAFGGMERTKDDCRDARGLSLVDVTMQDLRYAIRALRRSPGFAIAAMLSLGLGIGANAAVFSVINALLLSPFPTPVGSRLVAIAGANRESDIPSSVSYPTFRDIEGLHDTFDGAVAFSMQPVSFRKGPAFGESNVEPAERRYVDFVSAGYFDVLQVHPAIGRAFASDAASARLPELVISDRLWRTRFGASNNVVGSSARIDGVQYAIVGVAPPWFHGTEPILDLDAWAPLQSLDLLFPATSNRWDKRQFTFLKVWALRKPSVDLTHVTAALRVLGGHIDEDPDERVGFRFVAFPEQRARPDLSVAAVVPWGASVFGVLVGLVLMIACFNVANIMLARATTRSGEMALRRALGATRGRIIRQLLTESGIVSVGGLLMGTVFGAVGLAWISSQRMATDMPMMLRFAPDARVVGFTVAIAVIAGMVSGLVPALRGAGAPISGMLRESERGGTGVASRRMRDVLVVAQLAISVVLLICAGLFLRSIRGAGSADLGFQRSHVLLLSTDLASQGYDSAKASGLYQQLLAGATTLPGVQSAALGSSVPFGFSSTVVTVYFNAGIRAAKDNHAAIWDNLVSPGYFETLRFPILQGRGFTQFDAAGAPAVAVVNESFAKRYWPNASALNQTVQLSADGPPVTIVGVVATGHYLFLNEAPRPFIYLPLAQTWARQITLHLKTTQDPSALVDQARALLHRIDPDLPAFDVHSLDQQVAGGASYLSMRAGAVLAGALGLIGLVQTLVGLYGVISYGVQQRTREFGIRMALGANRGDVIRGVVTRGLKLTAAGVGVGLLLSFAVTKLMSGLLVGVGATDSVTYISVTLCLGAMAVLTTYVPAKQAARLSPLQALRGE